jgi:RNA recognition motif-containing protein
LEILGKQIFLKAAESKEGTREKLENEQPRKLFIDHVPESLNQEILSEYFKKFGLIEDLKVCNQTRKDGTKLRYSFILFKEEESLKKTVN